jgi:ribonuclease VapC
MVLDTSAIVAVILHEPGSEAILRQIGEAPVVAVGAPALVESGVVLSNKLGMDARPLLRIFLLEAEAEVIPFTREHYDVALDAYARYGKGRHPAALNFGDCLTYATARVACLPLLYVGADFAHTDLARSPN